MTKKVQPKKIYATFDKSGRLVEAFSEKDITDFVDEGATFPVMEFAFVQPVIINRPRTYTVTPAKKTKKG